MTPKYSDILNAHKRISSHINKTPVLTSSTLNEKTQAEVYLKCENFQKVGAFKFRGAMNAILNLSHNELQKGVATHSSGNHAQALALAAKTMNIPAYIVMPKTAPKVKIQAVQNYAAEIIFCEPNLAARESTLKNVVTKTGAHFIPPYDHKHIICGQGTATLELLKIHPELDSIIAPVGGGGLLSGTSITAKGFNSNIKIYGAEPEEANDAYQSFKSNKLIPSTNPNTIADGLLTSLSDLTFHCITKYVEDILTVSENEIIHALRFIWERMKIIIEPSSAVAIAAILKNKELFTGKKIGIIISGGNVDLKKICEIIS